MELYNQLLLQGLAGIILRLTIVSVQRGTCAIIKVECWVYIPDWSVYISGTLDDMKDPIKVMSDDSLPFWTSVENYIYRCYSCLDCPALWTLYFTMYYELCNPKVDVVLPNWRSESQGAIYPCEWCSYYEVRAARGGNEGGNRIVSILKAGLLLGLDCGLWALCSVSMETTYQLENQAPWREEPQGSYLDFLLPKRIL